MKKYRLAACGGTFDHFHRGHRKFLKFALQNADKLVIGITSDNYPDNKREEIEHFSIREKSVVSFLDKVQALDRAEIVPIDNLFGPTISKEFKIEVIVVSEETEKGATLINNRRKEVGLGPFEILLCSTTKAGDGQPISSSRIRRGEIDREGKLYIHPFWLSQKLTLPETIRQILKRPLGTLIKGEEFTLREMRPEKTITVGDVVTKTCNELSFGQKISVIDFYVGREKKFSNITELGFLGNEEIISVTNPAGGLTPEVFKTARDIIAQEKNNSQYIVKIEGEEDLAVLPFLLAAPLGFTILYGQPNEGVVQVKVSEEKKNMGYSIVSRFLTKKLIYYTMQVF